MPGGASLVLPARAAIEPESHKSYEVSRRRLDLEHVEESDALISNHTRTTLFRNFGMDWSSVGRDRHDHLIWRWWRIVVMDNVSFKAEVKALTRHQTADRELGDSWSERPSPAVRALVRSIAPQNAAQILWITRASYEHFERPGVRRYQHWDYPQSELPPCPESTACCTPESNFARTPGQPGASTPRRAGCASSNIGNPITPS